VPRSKHGANSWDVVANSAHLAHSSPDVLPDAISFAFGPSPSPATGAGMGRPFYCVHTHRVLQNISRAFAIARHDYVSCCSAIDRLLYRRAGTSLVFCSLMRWFFFLLAEALPAFFPQPQALRLPNPLQDRQRCAAPIFHFHSPRLLPPRFHRTSTQRDPAACSSLLLRSGTDLFLFT
jgi:hypothetical protein